MSAPIFPPPAPHGSPSSLIECVRVLVPDDGPVNADGLRMLIPEMDRIIATTDYHRYEEDVTD